MSGRTRGCLVSLLILLAIVVIPLFVGIYLPNPHYGEIGEVVVAIATVSLANAVFVGSVFGPLLSRYDRWLLRFPLAAATIILTLVVPIGLTSLALSGHTRALVIGVLGMVMWTGVANVAYQTKVKRALARAWLAAAARQRWRYRDRDSAIAERWRAILPRAKAGSTGPLLEGTQDDVTFVLFRRGWLGEGPSENSVKLCSLVALSIGLSVPSTWSVVVTPSAGGPRPFPANDQVRIKPDGRLGEHFNVYATRASAGLEFIDDELIETMLESQAGAWRIDGDRLAAWDWRWDERDPRDILAQALPVLLAVRAAVVRAASVLA
jgi:hypothetical protein